MTVLINSHPVFNRKYNKRNESNYLSLLKLKLNEKLTFGALFCYWRRRFTNSIFTKTCNNAQCNNQQNHMHLQLEIDTCVVNK